MNNKNRYNNKKSYNKNERLRCDILFTENCTLACKYCYETRNRCCSKSTNMNFNTIRNAVDFAYNEARRLDYKNISFLIFGGEPLLNPDGVKYFAKYSHVYLLLIWGHLRPVFFCPISDWDIWDRVFFVQFS